MISSAPAMAFVTSLSIMERAEFVPCKERKKRKSQERNTPLLRMARTELPCFKVPSVMA